MKRTLIGVFLALAVVAANASDLKWLTSLPDAKAQAKAENKLVFMEFTGSDWCPPCKMLHSEVLESKAFADYASKQFVLVELDFPRKKEQSQELKQTNRKLAEEFKVQGYPTVVILDPDGKELYRKVGYGRDSAEEYIAAVKAGLSE